MLLVSLGGWVAALEGVRRVVTAKRSVDLGPGLGCITVLATFVTASVMTWLTMELIELLVPWH